jgi:hypothetical protein
MGLEMRQMFGFSSEQPCSPLVESLARGRFDYGIDRSLIEFERATEVLAHVRRDNPRFQRLSERLMASANFAIAKPADKITAAQAKRSCALQDEPSDRVCVLSEAWLKYWRHRAASIRLDFRTWPVGAIRRLVGW